MPLETEVLGMFAFTAVAFFGVAGWALVRTLRQEGRKVELLERQDVMDTYSPAALAELREWIEQNPNDPYVDDARRRYNECVEALQSADRYFYDWSESEIESLDRL